MKEIYHARKLLPCVRFSDDVPDDGSIKSDMLSRIYTDGHLRKFQNISRMNPLDFFFREAMGTKGSGRSSGYVYGTWHI
ncbi:MAG: hypothetical protein LUG54_00510 [Clostridiales bacterium]|nr:hypothetical protein [Clostridiales bacterium]